MATQMLLTDKISFQEICSSWKQMLGIDKKAIFYYTKIFDYTFYDLAGLKTLNYRGRVILASTFLEDIIFSWSSAFLIGFHFSIFY